MSTGPQLQQLWPLECALGAALLFAGSAASLAQTATVDLPAPILERYTGFYQVGERLVMRITRQDEQLYAQLTGQPAAAIYPQTAASFVYKVVAARVDFIPDPPMQINALVLHQNGQDVVAPRIDPAQAQGLQSDIGGRERAQTAAKGSEQAARALLASIASGEPDYASMTPDLASATREQLPQLEALMARLGPVQTLQFEGVGNQGWDLYLVQHERGSSQLRILLNPNGILAGALLSTGP